MKSSRGKTADVNFCFINYEMIKTRESLLNEWVSSAVFITLQNKDSIILRCARFFLIFYLNYQQGITWCCICIDKWHEKRLQNQVYGHIKSKLMD